MSDVIYEERYEDILPCYDVGLLLNILLASLLGIPFCAWEHLVGHVNLIFVFTGFCGYIALVLVFYSMLYLSICKDYQKISLYFLTGMAAALACALFCKKYAAGRLSTVCCFPSRSDSFLRRCWNMPR